MKSPVCSVGTLHKSSLNSPCSLGWIGTERSLQADELIYARVSKLGKKGSLSNMGSKVCEFGSFYQT